MGRDDADGNDHGRVDSDGIVEQCAYDLLQEVDGLGRQQGVTAARLDRKSVV